MCSSLRSYFGRVCVCVCGQLRSTSSFMTIITQCCGGIQHWSAILAFNIQNVLIHMQLHPCLPMRSTTPVICANICWMTLAVISTQCQSSLFQTVLWHVRSVSISIHSGPQRRTHTQIAQYTYTWWLLVEQSKQFFPIPPSNYQSPHSGSIHCFDNRAACP